MTREECRANLWQQSHSQLLLSLQAYSTTSRTLRRCAWISWTWGASSPILPRTAIYGLKCSGRKDLIKENTLLCRKKLLGDAHFSGSAASESLAQVSDSLPFPRRLRPIPLRVTMT